MNRMRLLLVAIAFAAIVGLSNTPLVNADKTVALTFNKDVASIFYKNCVQCHRTGEIAPMSLITYKEIRPWAKSIREKVIDKEMPPWHADPAHGTWAND